MQKITPFLWFETEAEEAMRFYCSVFRDATPGKVTRFGEGGPGEPGSVLTAEFELHGMRFTALNGRAQGQFNETISFHVGCESQEEIDELWGRLLEGGAPRQCGWLTDRYGVSWQIIPTALGRYLGDPDPEKARRVMEAMLQMVKMDIPTLTRAYEG